MTDYILIAPDGQLTEKAGYPGDAVGCHGYSGQTLYNTKTYSCGEPRTLRIMACDRSLLMADEHPENPVATIVIGALGYPIPFRGNVAVYTVDQDNEPTEMTPAETGQIQALASVARLAADLGVVVTVVDPEA
jgi:hypothetical protein